MHAAQLPANALADDRESLHMTLVQARFEALAEWGMPISAARVIAQAISVDIVEAVGLLRQGCPAELVIPIIG